LEGADLAAECFEILFLIEKLGALQKEVIVVRGQAFRDPKAFGVVLVLVVEGTELHGAELFHIPGMEKLMADEA
jgi:hypothetical protein